MDLQPQDEGEAGQVDLGGRGAPAAGVKGSSSPLVSVFVSVFESAVFNIIITGVVGTFITSVMIVYSCRFIFR